MRAGLVLLLLTLVAPAFAQSKKYPAVPVDKDEEEAQKSRLWDQATNPAQVPYQTLVKDATKLIAENRPDPLAAAVKKLDEAIPLMPNAADAYRLRGDAHMALQDWTKCAADYDAAWQRTMRDPAVDPKTTHELRRRLGLCQARDGKLADAERTLAETAATGVNSVEIWMRLGEVRIAQGKLEGAIAALQAALQQTDITGHALVKWLLAGAYDRARQPADARTLAQEALAADRSMSMLKTPTLPLLGSAEEFYMLGLAYEAHEPARPEQALVQFRRFLKLAPDSPWRKRAEDHVRELKSARLPDHVERVTGNAPYEENAMRETVRKGMAAMRTCLSKTPMLVLAVRITKTGPKGPDGARWRAPPEGIDVRAEEMFDTTALDRDTAVRCVEPIAQKLKLPKPKEKETYYTVLFRVVGP
jgi:tetratricopeptide (TPR) repeat protein